jgi:tetratricopeptide (TPR) repeat protein
MGDYSKAEQLLNEGLAKIRKPFGYIYRGRLHAKRMQYDLAIKDYKTSMKLDPGLRWIALCDMGWACNEKGSYRAAEKLFSLGITATENHAANEGKSPVEFANHFILLYSGRGHAYGHMAGIAARAGRTGLAVRYIAKGDHDLAMAKQYKEKQEWAEFWDSTKNVLGWALGGILGGIAGRFIWKYTFGKRYSKA